MVSNTKTRGYMFDDSPRGVLEALVISGSIFAALTFAPTVIAVLAGVGYVMQSHDRVRKKKLTSAVNYLVRQRYIQKHLSKRGVRIHVTERGRERLVRYQKEKLLKQALVRPAQWDRQWRIILFDIPTEDRAKRNAFRSLIQRLGAVMLQKSVWIHPFDCSEHINLLRDIFYLSDDQLRLVTTRSIGDDVAYRKYFKL